MTAPFTHQTTPAWIEEPAIMISHGRLRELWYRIRLTIQDMNYASRRLVELQAPWSVDKDWDRG
jgi:hypothetical protein